MNNFYHYYTIVYMYWIDINTFIVNVDAFYTFYTCICISGCISAGSVFDIACFFFKWMFMYTIMSCVYYIHNVYTCMHHIIDIETYQW